MPRPSASDGAKKNPRRARLPREMGSDVQNSVLADGKSSHIERPCSAKTEFGTSEPLRCARRPGCACKMRARKKPGFSENAGLLGLRRPLLFVVMHNQVAVAAENDFHFKSAAPAVQHADAAQQTFSSFHLRYIGAAGRDAHGHLDGALAATVDGDHQHRLHRRRTGENALPQPAVIPILDASLLGASASRRRAAADFSLLDSRHGHQRKGIKRALLNQPQRNLLDGIDGRFLDHVQRPFLPGIRWVALWLCRDHLPNRWRVPMTRFRLGWEDRHAHRSDDGDRRNTDSNPGHRFSPR